jgi:hypothetical protein
MSIDDELDALHQAMDQLLDRIVDANPQVRAGGLDPSVLFDDPSNDA